jgi:hypothetical protein
MRSEGQGTAQSGGRRMRRVVLCIALAGAMLSSRLALAQPGDLNEVRPDQDAYAEDRPLAQPPVDRLVAADLSLGAALINVVYHPIKLAVGVGGAVLGGVVGALTGGDEEAAAGVWNVTTDGSYFTTPARLDSRRSFEFGGDVR